MDETQKRLTAAISSAAKKLGYTQMKPKQQRLVENFVSGRDVFGILPTGFGKSLCFACLPLVFDEVLLTDSKSIVVITTPLTAIMKDQVRNFSSIGLSCISITREHCDREAQREVSDGTYQLVYISPELLLEHRRWRSIICSAKYSECLKGFVVDEAHTVIKWGDTFRKSLQRIGELRSILPEQVNIMALTATATKSLCYSISRVIGLRNPYVLAICPCKNNITYAVGRLENIKDTFMPLVKRLILERTHTPHAIICCRRFEDCADIYILFRDKLGNSFTDPP